MHLPRQNQTANTLHPTNRQPGVGMWAELATTANQLRSSNYVYVPPVRGAGIGSCPMMDEVTAPRRLHFNDCFWHQLISGCVSKRSAALLAQVCFMDITASIPCEHVVKY